LSEWKKDPATGKKIRDIMRDPTSTTLYMAGIYRLEAQETTPSLYHPDVESSQSDIRHS